jgi:hypothetical protein
MIEVDDSEGTEQLIELIGATYLDCLHRLDKEGLLRPNGPIENLGLVMGLMLSLADEWDNTCGPEIMWAAEIIKLAREKGIELLTVTAKIEPYEDDRPKLRQQYSPEERWCPTVEKYNFTKMVSRVSVERMPFSADWKRLDESV